MIDPLSKTLLAPTRLSLPALVAVGLAHLAVLWLLLQAVPLVQTTRRVVYQNFSPITRLREKPPSMAVQALPVIPPERGVPTAAAITQAPKAMEPPTKTQPVKLQVVQAPSPLPPPPPVKPDEPVPKKPEPTPTPAPLPAVPPREVAPEPKPKPEPLPVPPPPVPVPAPTPPVPPTAAPPPPAPAPQPAPVAAPAPVPSPVVPTRSAAITPVEPPAPAQTGGAGRWLNAPAQAPSGGGQYLPPLSYPRAMVRPARQPSLADMANQQLNPGPARDNLGAAVEGAAKADCLAPNQAGGLLAAATIAMSVAQGKCK
jgi:hypothetical protein